MFYNEQQCKGGLLDKTALAVTWNPKAADDVYENPVAEEPTQIQLCPWFIDWLKNHEFKLARDVFKTNIGRLVINSAGSNRFGFRQIGTLILSIPRLD